MFFACKLHSAIETVWPYLLGSVMKGMKKCYGGVIVASIFMVLVLRYATTQNPFGQSLSGSIMFNTTNQFEWVKTNPLEWIRYTAVADVEPLQNNTQVIPMDTLVSSLYVQRNLTKEERNSLLTWNQMKHMVNHSQALPNAVEASKEASYAWNGLMTVIDEEKLHNDNRSGNTKEKQCPHYLNRMNALELNDSQFRLLVPCGLTQGSSITIIGSPNGLLGNFRIDLTGEQIPGEPEPPIILHYNVRLHGDQLTEDPVIVQNTWTAAHDWGEEERCPSPEPDDKKKVDELDQCNEIVGKDVNLTSKVFTHGNGSNLSDLGHDGFQTKRYFPFKQRYPFVATLRVGSEGIQMTVDGKHITSFAYRETLEPWLIGEVRISGDLHLISVLASGLPTSEDLEHVRDLEVLKAVPVQDGKPLDLFIGIFSTANNFKRRMAVRRTWMQYPQVCSGSVVIRFFVGLHKNQRVNEELWNEARTYGDVQLMPFVDYYSLITWKTVAICIFGTRIVSANYVMKTDDDAFVRVDEVIASLNRINVSHGVLYGLINSDSRPHRSPDSKWFISTEEWLEETYPPWAHGPGYVVSHDIANAIAKRHYNGDLKMFKLEDVAMGIWIADMKKDGFDVRYENEQRVYNEGCRDNYVVAHYQSPRDMLCLWQKLEETKRAFCCGDGMR
ncbi:beta-1,3-galactosyltransferase GALT1-like [Silene latifolia]|uniref:beta-1,3-galactosyltransferase GALT1-like n=1 Tax=Silene latifolia TaxID=37657 RepID=UPI003D789210